MSVRDTSLDAYASVIPELSDRQAAVLSALEGSEPLTNAEIAQKLAWTINRVTPRCLELRTLGRVKEAGKRKCRVTGRTAYAWAPGGYKPAPVVRMVPTEVEVDGVRMIRLVPESV